jgi:hypothetical protein
LAPVASQKLIESEVDEVELMDRSELPGSQNYPRPDFPIGIGSQFNIHNHYNIFIKPDT